MAISRWVRRVAGVVVAAVCLAANTSAMKGETEISLGGSVQTLGASTQTCGTGEELIALLRSNPGGTITLENHVTIDFWANGVAPSTPVTVDAGPYTINISNQVIFSGNIAFEGTGTVLQCKKGGNITLYSNGSITATGDNAVGIYLEEGSTVLRLQSPITANGANAVGIYGEGDWVLNDLNVTAQGPGSAALYTTGSAHAILSSLEGDEAAVVSQRERIVLEGSIVKPVPPGSEIWTVYGLINMSDHELVTTVGNPLSLRRRLTMQLPTSYRTSNSSCEVTWHDSGIDYNTAGVYPLTYTVHHPFVSDTLVWTPDAFQVVVLSGDRAHIDRAALYEETDMLLYLVENIVGARQVKVWCSADGGESWWDLLAQGRAEIRTNGTIFITGLPDDATYLFYLEVLGGSHEGISNTLEYYANPEHRGNGGEREGDGDEDGSGGLPPVTNPPPTDGGDKDDNGGFPPVTNPPPTGGNAGEDNNSTGGGSGVEKGNEAGNSEEPGDTVPGGTTTPSGNRGESLDSNNTGDGWVRGIVFDTGASQPAPGEVRQGTGDTAPEQQTPVAGNTLPTTPYPQQAEESAKSFAREQGDYPEQAQVYTADELAVLAAANPQSLVFLWDGMGVLLPTGPLLEAVGDRDLAILLEQEVDGFAIRLWAGGEELAHLGGTPFQVYLPLAHGQPVCTGRDGQAVPLEIREDKVFLTLSQTGSYTLGEEPALWAGEADGTGREAPIAPGKPGTETFPAGQGIPPWAGAGATFAAMGGGAALWMGIKKRVG